MTILQAWRSRTAEHINSFALLLNTLNKWLDVFMYFLVLLPL